MPLRYTSDIAEHTAVRTAAGLFDLSHMGEIGVSGPDAGRVPRLRPRRQPVRPAPARCALHDDLRGGRRRRRRPDRLPRHATTRSSSSPTPRTTTPCSPRFAERTAGFDVTVEDRSPQTALIAVQGPRALEILRATDGLAEAGHDAETLKYYAAIPMTFEGNPVLVARTGYTGEDGFEFFLDAALAPALWRAFLAAGEPFGLVPAGLSARDSLRLEAGMPLYGNELDRTTTPHDAGLGRVVKLDKVDDEGDPLPFVGRAALEGRAAVGAGAHARRARGPRPPGRAARLPGADVRTAADAPRSVRSPPAHRRRPSATPSRWPT